MSLITMIPDLDAAEHSDDTWLAVHKVPTLVPVTYAAIDEGLYDDPEYFGVETVWDRWPFLCCKRSLNRYSFAATREEYVLTAKCY